MKNIQTTPNTKLKLNNKRKHKQNKQINQTYNHKQPNNSVTQSSKLNAKSTKHATTKQTQRVRT